MSNCDLDKKSKNGFIDRFNEKVDDLNEKRKFFIDMLAHGALLYVMILLFIPKALPGYKNIEKTIVRDSSLCYDLIIIRDSGSYFQDTIIKPGAKCYEDVHCDSGNLCEGCECILKEDIIKKEIKDINVTLLTDMGFIEASLSMKVEDLNKIKDKD